MTTIGPLRNILPDFSTILKLVNPVVIIDFCSFLLYEFLWAFRSTAASPY